MPVQELLAPPTGGLLTVEVSDPTGQQQVLLEGVRSSTTAEEVVGMALSAMQLPPTIDWDLQVCAELKRRVPGAAVGLYGVMAYSVEQRTSEIGVRMALGADRGQVTKMVLRGAFSQIGIGMALGIPAAIGAGKLMSDQLFGVKPWNPIMLALAVLTLALAALLASVIPARRAAEVEPMVALRNE